MGLQRKPTPSSTGQIEMAANLSKVHNSTHKTDLKFNLDFFLETYENILNFKNITEVLEKIHIIHFNHSTEIFKKEELVKLLRNIKPQPVYPDGLFTLDLRDYFRGKNIKTLVICLRSRINSSTLLIGKVSFESFI